MLGFFSVLLVCQLAGEIIVMATGFPVPGPVVGMAILFLGLIARGNIPKGLSATADGLLTHLSLLFVPAGVGIMLHLDLLRAELTPILVALVLSTVLTIAVTASVMRFLGRGGDRP